MRFQHLKHFMLYGLVAAGIAYSLPALSAESASSQKIEAIELQQKRAQRELEFNRVKYTEAQKKLDDMVKELATRQAQLKLAQNRTAENASEAELELLKNEQQRLAVAELSVQSQQSIVDRLGRKQGDLEKTLADIQSDIGQLHRDIADAKDQKKQQARQQALADQQELDRLRKENLQLKTTLTSERDRLNRAELRVEELVKIADLRAKQITQLEDTVTQLTQPAAVAAAASKPNSKPTDLSTTVLEGEAPIYDGEDGERIIIRSHSIEENVVMNQVGPHLYQAEVKVEPGKAYFDLRRRRYRGNFPTTESNMFRFYYDLTDVESPRLYVESVNSDQEAMVTNAASEF